MRRRERGTFIQNHLDVGAEQALDLHRALGREEFLVPVDMRGEPHAFLGDLAQLGERHDLEAAGIGQDRARPLHEFV